MWEYVSNIFPGNRVTDTYFGWSVALSETYVVVGSTRDGDTIDTINNGIVHIFERNYSTGTWDERYEITGDSINVNVKKFGFSVAISGDRVIVGAPDSYGNNTGGAYYFDLPSRNNFYYMYDDTNNNKLKKGSIVVKIVNFNRSEFITGLTTSGSSGSGIYRGGLRFLFHMSEKHGGTGFSNGDSNSGGAILHLHAYSNTEDLMTSSQIDNLKPGTAEDYSVGYLFFTNEGDDTKNIKERISTNKTLTDGETYLVSLSWDLPSGTSDNCIVVFRLDKFDSHTNSYINLETYISHYMNKNALSNFIYPTYSTNNTVHFRVGRGGVYEQLTDEEKTIVNSRLWYENSSGLQVLFIPQPHDADDDYRNFD